MTCSCKSTDTVEFSPVSEVRQELYEKNYGYVVALFLSLLVRKSHGNLKSH